MGSKQTCLTFALERGIIFITPKNKHICCLLERETLSLSCKAILCTNILENIVWNTKGSYHLCSHDVQTQKRSTESCIPTVIKVNNQFSKSTILVCMSQELSTQLYPQFTYKEKLKLFISMKKCLGTGSSFFQLTSVIMGLW